MAEKVIHVINISEFEKLVVTTQFGNQTHCNLVGLRQNVGITPCPKITDQFLKRYELGGEKVLGVVLKPEYADLPGCRDCIGAIELAKFI